jgi:hypothetical protein
MQRFIFYLFLKNPWGGAGTLLVSHTPAGRHELNSGDVICDHSLH